MVRIFALVAAVSVSMAGFSSRSPRVNYDETKVFPYELEDPLTFADGRKVANVGDWRRRRKAGVNCSTVEPPK